MLQARAKRRPLASAFRAVCVVVALCGGARAAAPQPQGLTPVRQIDRWIDLSGAARPAAVLCPDQPLYLEAARAIAAAIERRGVPRPIVTCDPKAASPQTYNVVAVGNVNNNELAARLYFNHYAYEDSLLPGAGGYTIRTVHDPYPWHGQGDVVVVGVSDGRAAAQAAAKFAQCLQEGKTRAGLDYTLDVSTAPPLTDAQLQLLEREQTPSFYVFLNSASEYLKTGREAYARHAIATLRRIVELYGRTPGHDCDWPEETHSSEILAAWDAFEECPLISDAERPQFTSAMLQFMRALVKHVSGYSAIGTDDLVSWNHTTFPLLGLYFGSRYFHDYYGLPEAAGHLEKARACLLAQAKSWKPQEDADNYLIITMRHAIEYCLAEWNLEFFESGRMRRYADYVIGVCDSAGLPAGFGDSGLGSSPTLIPAALPIAFWRYRDPECLWLLRHVSDGKWPNPFHGDVEPRRPDRHTGVRVFPLDAQVYEFTKRKPVYNEPVSPPNVPVDAAFDKIAFRESWDKDAQYLLLDGFSRGKHLHYDAGAIIELVDRGHRWLIDHDYLTRNTTEHNMLSVIQDGRSDQLIPSCAGLLCQSDVGGRIGMAGVEVRDYGGVDWRRHIFWRKGGAFVVMDSMTARKDANYDLDLVWKVEDQGDEGLFDANTFMARRSSPNLQAQPTAKAQTLAKADAATAPVQRFWIKWPDAVRTTVKRSHPKGIVAPVRKLYQRIDRRLEAGETAEAANLIYTDDAAAPTEYRIERIARGAVVLRGDDNALCAVRGAQIDGLTFDADMLYLSPSRIAWANGRSLACQQGKIASAEPSNLELDVAAAKATAQTLDGRTAPTETDGLSADLVRRLFDGWKGRVASGPGEKEAAKPVARPAWAVALEGGDPVRRLKLADLDQDGKPEILAAAGEAAFALSADGQVLWRYRLDGPCHDVDAGELTAEAGLEVAVAGGDTFGHLLDRRGKLISKHQIRGAVWNQSFGDRPWAAYTVVVRDLDQDGKNELVFGTQNMELHLYDATWRQLARTRRAVLHGSIDFHTVDADLDGKLELFATDHYGSLHVFRHNGVQAASYYSSIGDVQAVLADLDGDKRVEVIHGSSTGDLLCAKLPIFGSSRRSGQDLWRFDNFGYGVNRLRSADLNADGTPEIIVASQTGCLYVLDVQGRVQWQDRAGVDVVEVLVLSGGELQLAYFDRTGVLTLATGDGKTRKRVTLDLEPTVALQLGESILVGAGGQVCSFRIKASRSDVLSYHQSIDKE